MAAFVAYLDLYLDLIAEANPVDDSRMPAIKRGAT